MNKRSLVTIGIIHSYVILMLLVVFALFSMAKEGVGIFNLLLLSLSVMLAVFLRSNIKYGLMMSSVISMLIATISFFLLFIPAERYTQPTGMMLYIGLLIVILLFIMCGICAKASNVVASENP